MRKFVLPFVAAAGFLALFVAWRDSGIRKPQTLPEPSPPPSHQAKAPGCVEAVRIINKSRSATKAIYAPSMPMKLRYGRQNFRCYGELACRDGEFFRLRVRHRVTGEEMDVGSNDKIFWFWSKRMDPPVIFFCDRSNFTKSNLKTPLHPGWMTRSLSLGPLDMAKADSSTQDDQFYYLYEAGIDGSGNPITFVYTISKAEPKVMEIRLKDEGWQTVATTTYDGPRIVMDWLPEDMAMEWDLSGSVRNPVFKKDYWTLPTYEKQVEIGQ